METHKIELINPLTLKDDGIIDTGIPEILVTSITELREKLQKEKLLLAPITYDPKTHGVVFSVIEEINGKFSLGYIIKIEKYK